MAEKDNKWIISTVVAAIISIASITFGASALVRSDSIKTVSDRQAEDSRKIATLEATYPNIKERLDQIYDMIAKHMGIK